MWQKVTSSWTHNETLTVFVVGATGAFNHNEYGWNGKLWYGDVFSWVASDDHYFKLRIKSKHVKSKAQSNMKTSLSQLTSPVGGVYLTMTLCYINIKNATLLN